MPDRNRPGLRFYTPSAGAQIRAAMLRAHERGVEWSRIKEVLADDHEDGEAEAAPDLLDRLEPEEQEDTDEVVTSPSLDEKRKAWLQLNRVFK